MPVNTLEDEDDFVKAKTPHFENSYFTDLEGNKIEKGNEEQEVYYIIEGRNLQGINMNIDLHNEDLDFEYNGSILENDLLKNYTFKNDNKEQIKLKVINTKK